MDQDQQKLKIESQHKMYQIIDIEILMDEPHFTRGFWANSVQNLKDLPS